jgi:hypothetical protein
MALKMEARRAWGYSRKAAGGARLSLVHNEVHWLNPVPRGIRVLSGVAWITWEGEDIVLNPGQAIRFSPGRSHPLISAVGPGTLTVEMLN